MRASWHCSDARTFLAEVCLPTRQARVERVLTVSRDAIVRSRTRLVNALRGTFASEAIILPTASPVRLVALFEQASTELPEDLCEATAPLWQSSPALNVCLHTSDRVVQDKAKRDPLLRRPQTVPGFGPVAVTIFVATIIDPHRFASGRAVGAHLSLVPRLYQSGSTKHGNRQARWALTMAASALLNSKGDSALQQWARQLAARSGRKKACCAIAQTVPLVSLNLNGLIWSWHLIHNPRGLEAASFAPPRQVARR
jgi:transposase